MRSVKFSWWSLTFIFSFILLFSQFNISKNLLAGKTQKWKKLNKCPNCQNHSRFWNFSYIFFCCITLNIFIPLTHYSFSFKYCYSLIPSLKYISTLFITLGYSNNMTSEILNFNIYEKKNEFTEKRCYNLLTKKKCII